MIVGQEVTWVVDDFEGHSEYKGTIKEIYNDHIIVDCSEISDHLWFDDCNIGMLKF